MNKIKIISLICILYNSFCNSNPHYISLGGSCSPALNLRHLNLRTEAYPFDWMISSFYSLCYCLLDDFSHFFTDLKMNPQKTGVIDFYGFQFTHDFPTITNPEIDILSSDFHNSDSLFHTWESTLPLVKLKYQRRIDRFKHVCNSSDKVYFFRADLLTCTEAISLRDLLKYKFPNLNFVLIVMSHMEEFKTPWHLDGIENFYSNLPQNPQVWERELKRIGIL